MEVRSGASDRNATTPSPASPGMEAMGAGIRVPRAPRLPTFGFSLPIASATEKTGTPPVADVSEVSKIAGVALDAAIPVVASVHPEEEEWFATPPKLTDARELLRRHRQRTVLAAVGSLGALVLALAGLRLIVAHGSTSARSPGAASVAVGTEMASPERAPAPAAPATQPPATAGSDAPPAGPAVAPSPAVGHVAQPPATARPASRPARTRRGADRRAP